MRYYTGIGSRKTPPEILKLMTAVAKKLKKEHWILRSGGAIGADSAFEDGAGTLYSEIYKASDATPESCNIAKKFHPAWDRCSEYAQKLHGRNSFQILGKDLQTPSRFVLCWTPDGCISHPSRTINTGGTGTAISIAWANKIQVLNMRRDDHYQRVITFLKK